MNRSPEVNIKNKMIMSINLANIYSFKVNNSNTRKMCEICSKLTIKHQNDVIGVVLVFLLLTLTNFLSFSSVFIADFEQVNFSWEISYFLSKNGNNGY